MKYQYWKCTICKNKFRTSTQMAEFDVEEHLEKHSKELKEYESAKQNYLKEVEVVEKKHPKRFLGYWIENVTPPVKKKLWKCPDCGEEMTYHYKYFHYQNKHSAFK